MKANPIYTVLFVVLAAGIALPTLKAQAPDQSEDIMLQAFYWDSYADSKWTNLNSQAYELAQYFSLVWLPPSGNALSGNTMGYAPVYYFDQGSAFGTRQELQQLIASLRQYGAGAIADVVINHRNGVSNWTNFPAETYKGVTYTWGTETICSTDEVKDQPTQAKPTGAPDTGEDFNGARDIDHTNANVRTTVKAYLDFLKNEMGYAGWRYDMTKGFSASYVAEYNNAAGAYFSVGEFFDGSYDLCNNWINRAQKTSTTFDFPLKFQINKAFAGDLTQLTWTYNGTPQPAGLVHHPDVRRYAVTFVDNHDTYRDANKFTGNVLAANAFILCSPGVPSIFLRHWIDNKTQLKPMIAARKAARIHSGSQVSVLQRAAGSYVAEITGKAGKLIVKIGSGSYTAPAGFTLVTSGTDYAIWSNVPVVEPLTLSISPESGYYAGTVRPAFTATGGVAPVTIYYTTDGSEPTTASATVISGGKITVTSNLTVKAFAKDAAGNQTAIIARDYKTTLVPITVRWKNDLNWTKMNLYSWVPGTSTALTGSWPGTTLTADSEGWYSYTYSDRAAVNLIFNNGSAQTVDITNITESSCFRIQPEMSAGKYTFSKIECTPTGIIETAGEQPAFYPNPACSVVYFEQTGNLKSVALYTLSGQLVATDSEVKQLDVSDLPAGVYMLQFTKNDGNKRTERLMIQ